MFNYFCGLILLIGLNLIYFNIKSCLYGYDKIIIRSLTKVTNIMFGFITILVFVIPHIKIV